MENTTAVDAGGVNRTFVKMEQHALWLTKSVTGGGLTKSLKLCPIYKQIRELFLATVDPEAYVAPDVDVVPADMVQDPMYAMRLDGVDLAAPGGEDMCNMGAANKRTKSKFQNQVVELRVPHESELLARRSKDARVIRILAKPGDHRVFWLDEEDLDWLIRIMIVEYDLRGVPQLRDREYGSVPALPAPAAQASSVEDAGVGANARAHKSDPAEQVDVRWSFANDCWEVNFQEPPYAEREATDVPRRGLEP